MGFSGHPFLYLVECISTTSSLLRSLRAAAFFAYSRSLHERRQAPADSIHSSSESPTISKVRDLTNMVVPFLATCFYIIFRARVEISHFGVEECGYEWYNATLICEYHISKESPSKGINTSGRPIWNQFHCRWVDELMAISVPRLGCALPT
ncbi:hypothetical protein F4776DRAFT_152931 [Hypoxylon sp. NC0597]|nr:hypothetical protein F4776DRAFT_152931 [Hypoxylon sp. NC0597]